MKAAVLVMVAMCLLVTPGLAASYKSLDGSVALSAKSIGATAGDVLVADGKVHLHYASTDAKTTLEADADKIVAVLIQRKKSAKGATGVGSTKSVTSAIKSATLTGPVTMVCTFPDEKNGAITKITATADDADFDGATNVAHLTGHVKIVSENPAIFDGPAVMVGDKATVNLTPNLGPDQFRFRVESTSGLSTITATPKAKEEQ